MNEFLSILVCHQGEIEASSLDKYPPLKSCDLSEIEMTPPYSQLGTRLAEMRAFPLCKDSNSEFIGMVSWRMGAKRGDHLSWSRLVKRGTRLLPGQGLAPYLWRFPQEDLRVMAERSFPGMGMLVDRLRSENPAIHVNPWHVAGNSFIVSHDEMLSLDIFTRKYLEWDIWTSDSQAFLFRCPECGHSSETGAGRYKRNRDVGFFGEVATMYYFQSISNCQFVGIDQTIAGRAFGRLKKYF